MCIVMIHVAYHHIDFQNAYCIYSVEVYQFLFISVSLSIREGEHFCMCLFSIYIFSYVNYLFMCIRTWFVF